MSMQATSREDEHRTDLYGVRGWLLLLCIYLIIVMPLIAILGAIGTLQLAASAPDLRGTLISEGVSALALAGFAAYAGWALYRMRPKAVKIAKAYLITMLVLSILGWILASAVVVSQTPDNAPLNTLRTSAMVAILWPAILSMAWLVYLQRSKRVRASFLKE
jgi:Protein of unknown function (DUF2569)